MNTIIEKIRAEVEERKKVLHSTLFNDEYNDFLSFLSDLEKSEKPTNIDFEQELYKHFGQVKDFTLGMRIGQYFYELGKQSKQTEWTEEDEEMLNSIIATCKLAQEERDSSPARHLFKNQERWLKSHYSDVKSEKPVPADLEEAGEEYLQKVKARFLRTLEHPTAKDCFIAGAKWQAEQDQETIELAEDHAYFAGAVNEREKIMKEAVETEVTETCGIASVWIKTKQFKPGQKVKLIIVREV